jgi:beta-lactamase regulating signal transducer with metallopeptidase domain
MVVSVIGWTIIHSLWQCLGLLGVLKLFLGLVDVRRSGMRYTAALGVLGVAVVCVLATFLYEWSVLAEVRTAAIGGGVVRPGMAAVGMVEAPGMAGGSSLVFWLAKCCPYVTLGWLLGVVFYTGRLVVSGLELRRLRRLPGVSDVAAEGMLEGLRVRMRVLRPVRLLITDRVSEPMTFGFLRAVVVLPLQYLSFVPADQLEMILAHEVAHIRRRDYVMNLVQHVFDALLFFNPFFRMLSAMVREEREYCCDDWAARAGGDGRKMAVALTNLGLVKRGLALGLSGVSGKSSFYRRVTRLIEPGERPALSVRATLLGFLGAVVMVAVLTQCVRSGVAQDSLPVPGDRLVQLLTDNQAGYKEQVFSYTRAGRDHDIFLVQTQDERQAKYAYLDGVRVNREELGGILHVLKVQRSMPMVMVRGVDPEEARGLRLAKRIEDGDSVEKQIRIKEARGEDTTALLKMRGELVREEVESAMDEYKREVKHIPLDVEQHELLTRIIVNNTYTAEERQQLNELIRKRQELLARITVDGR